MAISGNISSDPLTLGPKVASVVHPLYAQFQDIWIKLLHVRTGLGGFIAQDNSSYIQAHPREWLDHSSVVTDITTGISKTTLNPNPKSASPKLKTRRRLARYENIAAAIIKAKRAALFRDLPVRRIGKDANTENRQPTPLEQWWEDIDGKGTHINDAMSDWWDLAASMGHLVLYFDVPEATGATAADQGWPRVRQYLPLDLLDWLVDDDGNLVSVKLLEAIPRRDYAELQRVTNYQVRIVDTNGWAVYDYRRGGAALDQGTHGLGMVPVVFLWGQRNPAIDWVGESILGSPQSYIDLFNLTSEKRELLRNQTFSFINVPLGTGPDAMSVDQAQAMMGQQTGVMNIMFSGAPASMLSADAANVDAYQNEIQQLMRDIYRITGMQWEGDKRAAETEGSLKIKREELNTRLCSYADYCERADYALAELYYRFQFGADVGEQKFKDDQILIHYPDDFEPVDAQALLQEVQAAISAGMPPLVLKALRKKLLGPLVGDIDETTRKALVADIDNAQADPTAMDRMKMKLQGIVAAGKKPAADAQAA